MNRTAELQNSEREAETTSSKATKAEFAKNYDQAFRLYVKAAEQFLHLSRSPSAEDRSKQKWKASAAKALERAERIKKFVDASRSASNLSSNSLPSPNSDILLTPVGINHFSTQEQYYILKKGARVNGLVFPEWEEPVHLNHSEAVYIDPDGQPSLSPEQQKVSPIWHRPSSKGLANLKNVRSTRPILPQEILQCIVTDCSVCASISVCLEHCRRFGPKLSSLVEASTWTSKGIEGRYDFRVLFNGAWRRIGASHFILSKLKKLKKYAVIDDTLPYHPADGTLMCMSVLPSPSADGTVSEEILWPSLLEKAYMKLMGGYDFPGSNSSIDLHSLAGWIPEYIEIKRSAFERERAWARIQKGFSSGQCLVTLGTGPNSYVRWRDIPLLPSHSYAVIDVYETEEGRFLTVIDSWVRSKGSPDETSRVLHIPWSEVLTTFEGVYLSWDPSVWQNTITFHSMWKRNPNNEDVSRQAQIEFSCSSDADEEIWVLLTRHVADTRRSTDFIALRVELDDDLVQGMDLAENQRILSMRGTYTNSTHVLARTRIPKALRSGILSILTSYEGDAREIGYTLTVYSHATMKISWVEKMSTPPFTNKAQGSFIAKNAGGNCTFPSFMVNPQYQLTIHPQQRGGSNQATGKAKLTTILQSNKDMPVNMALVWAEGRRVTELSVKDLVASSGAYSYGLARLSKTVAPGQYTLVASAFEPHHTGPFSLQVDCSHPFDLKPIPQESAGMYSKLVRGSWSSQTAAGAPSFEQYPNNPVFELDVPSKTQLMIRLQLLQPSSPIALNVTVFNNFRDDIAASLRQRHVATSGPYDDSIAGVATPQVTIGPGKYYVVPSTYNPGTQAGFRMVVYSSIERITVASAQGGRS